MSRKVSIKYLIDVAIGNPEPGVVNFNALYTVLQAISEKLDLEDEQIEIDSSFCQVATNTIDSKSNASSERLMNHQVYDTPIEYVNEEEHTTSFNKKSNMSMEATKTQRSVSLQIQQTEEDRKVAFVQYDKKNDEEEIPSRHETKKPKNLDIRQQIDFLCQRFEKVENLAVWSVDTEQSVECLRQIVQQLQCKIDSLERSVCELRDKRCDREVDISACRTKLQYEKLALLTNAMMKDLSALKESINGSNSNNLQLKKPLMESSNDSEIGRLDAQFIELKTNICILTEKLTNLEDTLAKTNKCTEITKLDLLENEISSLKAQIENSTVQSDLEILKELTSKLDEEVRSKVNKAEIDELLSEKADYCMLHGKVSVEVMDSAHCKFAKQLAEITDCVIINDERVQKQIDCIKELVGDENLKDLLRDFRLQINKDIQRISDDLKRISEAKPDVDSAVARLKDLACVSCDNDVVMKSVEVNNLLKFNDAHVSKSISPTITFEVGKLREAGKIGLFNDDDIIFQLEKKFRHCGGVHTIITNKDRIAKARLRKSK